MELTLLLETLRTGAVWIMTVILIKDLWSLFAQLAFLLVWNFGETEEISGLTASVTIILKSLFSFFPEPYTAMLHLSCSHLATLLRAFAFKCEEMSTREGGHRGQGAGSVGQTWNRSPAPHSCKWKVKSAHLMGHQSYLIPEAGTAAMVCIQWHGRVARCLCQLFVWHPLKQ